MMLIIVGGFVIGLELLCGIYISIQPNNSTDINNEYHSLGEFDPVLGYRSIPNGSSRHILRKNGVLEYDVLYETDALRRRVTPQKNLESREQFALFFGCSFTFGEGVENNETLPSQFAALAPEYHAYNYGCGGHGPQHMYLQLKMMNALEGVEESQGIVVYSLFREQIYRAVGNLRIVTEWGPILPCVSLEKNELVYKGSFEEAWPIWIRLYRYASISNVMNSFSLDWPLTIREKDFNLTAHLIWAAAELLDDAYDEVQLYVLHYPGRSVAEELNKAFQKIEQGNIRKPLGKSIILLDYSNLLRDDASGNDQYFADGHPTAYTHKRVAEALAHDIL